jgi:hypothetical protein
VGVVAPALDEFTEKLPCRLGLHNFQRKYAQRRHRIGTEDETLNIVVRQVWHGLKLERVPCRGRAADGYLSSLPLPDAPESAQAIVSRNLDLDK